jgi:hypothetical protein
MRTLAPLKVALVGLCLSLASGCSLTQVGQLYQMSTGQSTKLEAHEPVLSRGEVRTQLPNGSTCRGGFRTIDPQNAREMTNSQVLFSDNADARVAVLRCSSGEVLRCAFAGRPSSGLSYGTCRDQSEAEYAVIF